MLYLFDNRTFKFLERKGIHITPVKWFHPIPDTQKIPAQVWQRENELPGIDMRLGEMAERARRWKERFGTEYDAFPRDGSKESAQYYLTNKNYGSIDAESLYCFVRECKPRRIVEIGSGHSSRLTLQALDLNKKEDPGYSPEFTLIDPYVHSYLAPVLKSRSDVVWLEKGVQDVPMETFTKLGAGDILFIDSFHVLCINSDVQYEFLQILPRLNPGVLVHVHDIFFPHEYPEHWIKKNMRFYNEQYILQAFLTNNSRAQVRWAGYYMHLKQPEVLRECFKSYRELPGVCPGSFWFQTV